MTKNKITSLSWESFQAMGDPEKAELHNKDEDISEKDLTSKYALLDVRIWLDKKHRKGKKATIIKGVDLDDNELKKLCKEIKTMCGVGGAVKNGEIIIQGDQRTRILKLLTDKGFVKAKLAGG